MGVRDGAGSVFVAGFGVLDGAFVLVREGVRVGVMGVRVLVGRGGSVGRGVLVGAGDGSVA